MYKTEKVIVILPQRYKYFADEEISLVKTIYYDIIDVFFVKRSNPKYYVTIPLLEKLRNQFDFDKLIIMDRVRPRQLVNLTKELKKEIMDRLLLILEIFAEHAGSREAKLQIELARLKHQYPLIREAIRYAKLGELHGFLGAGRYGYEKYYVMLKEKEARIRREIEKLRKIREVRRKRRGRENIIKVALVGYTCAGKTTLFNYITGLGKPVGPEPFTTLSPKTSAITFMGKKIYFTDTVGFIRDLPPEIVEAFYATLEEIKYSDIIVNIVDASKTLKEIEIELIESSNVFSRLGIHGKPVIVALNKIDLVEEDTITKIIESINMHDEYVDTIIPISASKGTNIDVLLREIIDIVENGERLEKNICTKIRAPAPER